MAHMERKNTSYVNGPNALLRVSHTDTWAVLQLSEICSSSLIIAELLASQLHSLFKWLSPLCSQRSQSVCLHEQPLCELVSVCSLGHLELIFPSASVTYAFGSFAVSTTQLVVNLPFGPWLLSMRQLTFLSSWNLCHWMNVNVVLLQRSGPFSCVPQWLSQFLLIDHYTHDEWFKCNCKSLMS